MDVDVPVILSAPEEQRYIINDAIYKKETQNCQQVLFYNVVISLCAIGLRPAVHRPLKMVKHFQFLFENHNVSCYHL